MRPNPRTAESYQLFLQGVQTFSRMEQAGMRVDVSYVCYKKDQLTTRMNRLEQQFRQTNFFKHWSHTTNKKVNINSDDQLAHFLYVIKKITPPKTTPSGRGSTDEETLKQLDIPELDILLERSRWKKAWDVLNGFEQEQVDGVIHPSFNLHLVRTFRSSSDSPNMQNVPKRDESVMQTCRQALLPRPGHQLVEIDFSKIEVRVAACYCHDTNLIRYIKNPASDMHADMARQLFMLDTLDKNDPNHNTLYQAAKNGFVFPQFYGDYYRNCANNMACLWGKLSQGRWSAGQGVKIDDHKTLADHLISKGVRSFEAFVKHIQAVEQDFWGNRFGEYAEWKERWWRAYCKNGYVDLLTGFRCGGVMDRKECINYPIQGTAFHCLLKSLILTDEIIQKERWDSRIIGQIHDSMIICVNPKELNHIINVVKGIITELPKIWNWIIVPMEADVEIFPINGSWAEKQKI